VFGRGFLIVTLVPVLDIVLLAWIGSKTSWALVLGLVIGTGILGAWLARHQGLRTVQRISAEMQAGQMPADSLLDGLLILVAAVLLIIPGFLTDVVAIALLIPPSRKLLKEFARSRLQSRVTTVHYTNFGVPRDQIIDVKVVDSPPRQLPK
jgi:UPF0716 protein FxsA